MATYTVPTMARPISDMGGSRVLISMKFGTTEVMVKNGLVRLSADNTVSHINAAGTGPILMTGTTTDLPFGICMNDKESGINADGKDMVDVLLFTKCTLVEMTAPSGGFVVQTAYGPAYCVKGALEGALAELIV
jgi:hypothetical protein